MAGTQGIGTFGINSKFASGSLVFYEKAVGRTATGDVFTVGTAAVKVGGTAQDVDFQYYGTGSLSAIIDAGLATLTLVGITATTNKPLTISDATESTSTTTGALIVTGGLGVAKKAYLGSQIDQTATITGATALNAFAMNITDTQTHSTGYARGLYVNYNHSSGAITGDGEVNPLAVDMTLGANIASNAYTISIYTAISGTPTIGEISTYYAYMDTLAGTISGVYAVNLNMVTSTRATNAHAFFRCYAHVSNGAKQLFWLDGTGNKCADYFIETPNDQPNLPTPISYVGSGTLAGSGTVYKMAVKFGSTVGYIPIVTTVAAA